MKESEIIKDLTNQVEKLKAEVNRLRNLVSNLKVEKEELEREYQNFRDETLFKAWQRGDIR